MTTAKRAFTACSLSGAHINMADVGQAWHVKRGFAERFLGIVEDEEVGLSDYENFHDAYSQIDRFIDDVARRMRQRTLRDSSLVWLTAAEFEQQWHDQQPPGVSAGRLKNRRYCVQFFHKGHILSKR